MNENSFICIKINSWLSTIEFRQHFFLSIDFFSIIIISTADSLLIWSDQNEILSALISIIDFIQINILTADFFLIKQRLCQHSFLSLTHTEQFFQQLIFFWSNGGSVSTPSYHRLIQVNFFNNWFFLIKWRLCQHSFLSSAYTDQILIFFSWNNPSKTTLYEDFWWFSYRRIFSSIFFHELNFEFYFNSFYRWNK